jgi:hypothetical protein
MTEKEMIRHASNGHGGLLCGPQQINHRGRITRPKETVNCPDCRVVLNHIRELYPQHAGYMDWRLTAEARRQAAADFVADMCGGAND